MTNLDRIRGMTLDELAEILSNTCNCEDFCVYAGTSDCMSLDSDFCRIGIKKWLEQEAETE